jgi:hypothetical protein
VRTRGVVALGALVLLYLSRAVTHTTAPPTVHPPLSISSSVVTGAPPCP